LFLSKKDDITTELPVDVLLSKVIEQIIDRLKTFCIVTDHQRSYLANS